MEVALTDKFTTSTALYLVAARRSFEYGLYRVDLRRFELRLFVCKTNVLPLTL